MNESALYEKLAGSPDRRKYRIRIYDGSDAFIRLECKEKRNGKVSKRGVRINRAVYDDILNGSPSRLSEIEHPLAREVAALMREKRLRPSVIVNYTRDAYIHPLSTTRITFDRMLNVPVNTLDLFAEQTTAYIFPANETILEIKYDQYLPQYVAELLRCNSVPIAASKFVLCTEYLSDTKIKII